ncbi:uncharacterized protein LOC115631708 [Scaptodrosophila lebanonensis]|uniref:Uncharacterized protein LOC115631708 n=1 Tax=Drosophila lebanonensis TaxID=7225 RepID=A0A6J2U8T8_DROLE|nr:uncharacterized protein LOC115631708 [Scaptodrosophila lebanonensis]
MPWLAYMLAALALLFALSDCNRLQKRHPNPYEDSNAESGMKRSNYWRRCGRYASMGDEKGIPVECLDNFSTDVDNSSSDDSLPAKRGLDSGGILDHNSASMLRALFGFQQTTPAPTPVYPTDTEGAAVSSHQLPPMYYDDFYEDLLATKRNDVHSAGCDCKVTNELIDLGSQHVPRYLMNAVCESRSKGSGRDYQDAKCMHGANCRPLEYKVKVLMRGPSVPWEFKTVTVTAGCFCAK